MTEKNQGPAGSRREFLKSSTAAVVGASVFGHLRLPGAYAAGDDLIRVGLVGCGGRGTGAARDALRADPNVKLVAMGDTFADRLQESLANLKKTEVADKVAVDTDHQFVGFDAYQRVIDSGVDVVILAAPPHFRPAHLKYAVEAGKHVFAEKPVAVDAPGVRSVLATCEEAKSRRLSIVSGLCWRYHPALRETMKHIHDGALGDIVAMQCSYNTVGLWMHPRRPEWSDMEWQVRNWLYFTWLSGDHIVEQHIHSLDKMAWAMLDRYPAKATSMGGRQVRTGPEYGHIYDHFATVFECDDGVRLFSTCRQQDGCTVDVSDHVMGTKGTCHIVGDRTRMEGDVNWQSEGSGSNMYQVEHDELFASIRSGQPINNGHYMAMSTMMAIMGRMSAYTGKTITWEEAFHSQEDLTPTKYDWGPLEVAPVAMPGITPLT